MTNMTTPKDPSDYDSVPTVDTEVTIVNEEPELNTRRQWKLFAILNLVGWPLNFFMAFTIYSIESSHEDEIMEAHRLRKNAWNTSFKQLIEINNWSGELLENVTNLIKEAEDLVQEDPGEKQWTMLRAIGLIGETSSTVGYGSITPTTDAGKLTMAFFAIILVPFGAFIFGLFGKGTYKMNDMIIFSTI